MEQNNTRYLWNTKDHYKTQKNTVEDHGTTQKQNNSMEYKITLLNTKVHHGTPLNTKDL